MSDSIVRSHETIEAVIRENLASAVVEDQRDPGLAHAFRMNARGAFHAWDRLTHPEEQPVWFADRKRLEATGSDWKRWFIRENQLKAKRVRQALGKNHRKTRINMNESESIGLQSAPSDKVGALRSKTTFAKRRQ